LAHKETRIRRICSSDPADRIGPGRRPNRTKLGHGLLATVAVLCIAAGDGRSQYVEDSIDVGSAWVGSLVYVPEQDEIWGTTTSGSSAFAISCDSNKVVANVPVHWAGDLAHNPVDGKLYCAYYGAGGESLAVISATTHVVIKRMGMPGSTRPVWDSVSNRLYVSCQSTNSVAVLDCASDSILRYIPVGACPIKMYINPRRHKLYVLNHDAGTVSIVNMTTNQVIKTVGVGGYPNAGYYCRSADKFYSAGPHNQCVVIGGLSDTIVARISLPGIEDILGAAGNEDAGLVYLGTFTGPDDCVATVLAERDSVTATVPMGREPWGLAYSAQSGLLYCTSAMTGEVSVLADDGARILTKLRVGACPFVLTLVPRHNRLYVGHSNTRFVYVLRDTATGAIAEPQSPLPEFCGVSVTPNPFTQSVAVVWNSLTKGGDAARVYAQDGRLVKQARIPEGEARWVWDGRDDSGSAVPPGVYVVEARTGVRTKTVKLK
jgi:YVTN family beta-propeller protein